MATQKTQPDPLDAVLRAINDAGGGALPDLLRMLAAAAGSGAAGGDKQTGGQGADESGKLLARSAVLLLNAGMQTWLQWQRVLPRHLPGMVKAAEAYRSTHRKSDRAAPELIDTMLRFVNELHRASEDEYRRLDAGLRGLLEAPVKEPAKPKAAPRRATAKPAPARARAAAPTPRRARAKQ